MLITLKEEVGKPSILQKRKIPVKTKSYWRIATNKDNSIEEFRISKTHEINANLEDDILKQIP